jgi:eukaryotic-like serine/threonine-protein kinase
MMNVDRDLLFGLLALQARLIDVDQLITLYKLRATCSGTSLTDALIERGWVQGSDRLRVDELVDHELRGLANEAGSGPAEVVDGFRTLGEAAPIGIESPEFVFSSADVTQACAPSPSTTANDPLATRQHYTLIRLHATGGIGRIWLARDNHLGREVAFKELRPEQAGNATQQTRFLKETCITGQLEHPGIVPVYEFGRHPDNRQPFYTMRFIRGRDLSDAAHAFHAKRTAGRFDPLEWSILLNAFVMVCNTVAYAHSRGVLHRDLKGQNVVVGDFGEVVVLDWGLAKVIGQSEGESSESSIAVDSGESGDSALTVQGDLIGTPCYMAPEQAAGHPSQIDCRTDVYGLGAILYEILTGQSPFRDRDTREVLRKVREEEPPRPRLFWADVPPALEAMCLRSLAKRPADRFASPGELAREVQQWQEVERKQAEDALRASEGLYHSLVETIPMNVWRKDAAGRFTFGNDGFCATTKRSLGELIGKTDFDLFPAELAEKYRRDDDWVMATGETFHATEMHQTADRETLHVQILKLPVHDGQGRIVGTQGIFWDVSDQKRLEDALTRTAAELAHVTQQFQEATGHLPKVQTL